MIVHREALLRVLGRSRIGVSLVDDCRKCQTATAAPAEPGDLLWDVRIIRITGENHEYAADQAEKDDDRRSCVWCAVAARNPDQHGNGPGAESGPSPRRHTNRAPCLDAGTGPSHDVRAGGGDGTIALKLGALG